MTAMRLLSSLFLLTVLMVGCAQSKATGVPSGPASPQSYPIREEPSSPPPRLLSSQVGREEEERLKQQAARSIESTEQMVRQINAKKLAKDQEEVLSTIRSFQSKAKEALALKDFSRASTLADKARILAKELLTTLR
ncbi:MAG: hypothetical protein ACREI5_02915 [Candidatus Methylomirabilales bacterium]